jgi:hypothetical protein
MRCRLAICTACCTRVNGINHCHACLKVLGSRRETTADGGSLWAVLAAMLLGVSGLVLFGLCWVVSGMMAP